MLFFFLEHAIHSGQKLILFHPPTKNYPETSDECLLCRSGGHGNAPRAPTVQMSLCHVNRPGIKWSNITHTCGPAILRAIRLGLLFFCSSRRPHWNVLEKRSPHGASNVKDYPFIFFLFKKGYQESGTTLIKVFCFVFAPLFMYSSAVSCIKDQTPKQLKGFAQIHE